MQFGILNTFWLLFLCQNIKRVIGVEGVTTSAGGGGRRKFLGAIWLIQVTGSDRSGEDEDEEVWAAVRLHGEQQEVCGPPPPPLSQAALP